MKTLRIHDPRYKTNPDLFCKAQIEPSWNPYESMDLQNQSTGTQLPDMIPATLIATLSKNFQNLVMIRNEADQGIESTEIPLKQSR